LGFILASLGKELRFLSGVDVNVLFVFAAGAGVVFELH
jgi:hypothetical protein